MASEREPPPASFRATVRWTLWELALCPAVGLALGAYIAVRRPEPVYGRLTYAAGCVVCWALFPIFTAWIAWPSTNRPARWLKAALGFLLRIPRRR